MNCSAHRCSEGTSRLIVALLTNSSFYLLLPSETQVQPVEAVEMGTTKVTEEDKPSSPLVQSPPAESSAGPSVPASREIKSRSETRNIPWPHSCFQEMENNLFYHICTHTYKQMYV